MPAGRLPMNSWAALFFLRFLGHNASRRKSSMSGGASSHLLLTLCLIAAEPGEDRAAPSAVRGSQYPRLHANGTVTFRVTAPSARQVQISPRGNGNGLGDKPLDMSKDAGG